MSKKIILITGASSGFGALTARALADADGGTANSVYAGMRDTIQIDGEPANVGEPTRQLDYQVWCGPAMGAFNEWAKGSFLEKSAARGVVVVALNLLYGACVHLRRQAARQQGVALPDEWFPTEPLERAELEQRLN